jgi:Flp pilus assembly protein TadB
MSFVVVGLLVALWTWVLLPGLLHNRREASTTESDTDHDVDGDALIRTASDRRDGDGAGRRILVLGDPEKIVSAQPRSRAELRRRAVLARGGFALVAAVVAGVALGGLWWVPAGVLGVPYVVYVLLAVRLERRLAEQRETLHDIAEERARRQPHQPTDADPDAVELVVGDATGIIVTGWRPERSTDQ